MHYLLDGYNILFRRYGPKGTLDKMREQFLSELNILAHALRLHITVVLDAYKQKGEEKRHHFRSLELLYTSFGQDADEYIIDFVRRLPQSVKKNTTIITSDRGLQQKVQLEKGSVLSVSSFFYELEKRIMKKFPRTHSSQRHTPQNTKSDLPALMDTQAWIALFENQ